MAPESGFCLEPLGAFYTVKPAEPREVLSGFCLFPQLQVFWREQISFDLVNIPVARRLSAATYSTRRLVKVDSDSTWSFSGS